MSENPAAVAPQLEWDRLELLCDLGRTLASREDPELVLDDVTRLMVPRLSQWAVLHLWQDGRLRFSRLAHEDSTLEGQLAREFETHDPRRDELVTRVADTSAPVLSTRLTHEGCAMGVPLLDARGLLGTLSLYAGVGGRTYDGRDLSVAMDVATRTAHALDHARRFQEAQAAIRWRDDVLAVVTHDLRNPLNAIALDLSTLRRPWKDAAEPDRREGRGQLESIKRALERVGRMVDDLLVASTMKAGHLHVHLAPQVVSGLLSELVQMLAPVARHRGISLEVSAAELPPVRCDRDRALQVLSNLVGNALTVSPKESCVRVTAAHEGGFVLFTVADQGPGVPLPLLERIFDRAWQGASGSHAGFGLGLFIVRGLVEAHGGRVWVEAHEGPGATFCFTLPVAA